MATRIRFENGKRIVEEVGSKTDFRKDREERYQGQNSSGRKSYGANKPAKATESTGIVNATSGPAGGSRPGDVATPALDSFTGTEHNAGMSRAVNATQAARQSVVPSAWGAKEGQDKKGDAAAELAAALTGGKPTGDTWEDENAEARKPQSTKKKGIETRAARQSIVPAAWGGEEGTEGGGERAEHIAGSIVNKAAAGLVGGLRDRVNYYGGTMLQDAADTARDTARAVGVNEQFAADFDRDPDAMKPFNEWKASLAPGEYEALEMNGQLPDPRTLYANAKQAEAEREYRAENGELELHRIANFGQKFQDEVQEKYGDVGGFWGMAGDAASSIGDQAPAMVLRNIPYVGGALSTAYLYGGAAQRGTEQALAEGASAEDALSYGTMSGIMEAATERMFDGMAGLLGKGAADEAIEGLVSKIGNTGARNLARLGLGAMGEGAEEFVSAIADPALKTIYNNQDLADSYKQNLDWGDVLYQSAMGLLTGGVMGSVGLVNGQYQALNDRIESRLEAEIMNAAEQSPAVQQVLEKAQANQQAEQAQATAEPSSLADIEQRARQAWETPYEDEYGTHERPGWETASESERFSAAAGALMPNYMDVINSRGGYALYSFINDLVAHGGDLNPYAAAQAFSEFAQRGGGFNASDVVARAYEIAGQEIPLGIRREYMPTTGEKTTSAAQTPSSVQELAQAMAPEPQAQEEQPSLSVEEASERVQQYEALADEYEKRFKAWKQANDSGVMDYPYVEENRWLSWAKTTLNSLQSDYTEAQRISRTGNKAVSPDYGTPDNYIGRRTYEEVANRSVKAFQFDHPELHKFFRAEAEKVAEGLDYVPITTVNSKKGTFHTMPNKNPAYLALKPYGLSNEGVSKAMEGVIADRGKENAAAKRAELYLHKRLFNGYIDRNGQRVPPNQEYIEALKKIPGAMEGMWQVERDAEESAMLFDRMSDEERARELAAWEAEHPRPTTQTPTQELAVALTGQPSQNSPSAAQEEISEAPGQAPIPAATETAQTEPAAPTKPPAAPIQPVPPAGTVRSQSEANTIQAVDEQVNAPHGVRTPLYYKPVSETESISAARKFLRNGYQSDSAPGKINSKLSPEQGQALTDAGARLGGGYGQAMSDMQGSGSWTGVQQDMSTLILEALASDAAATGNWDAYEAWRIVDQQHGEEIARTLQARGKRTRGKAVDILEAVSKTIEDADLSKESRDAAMTKAMPLAQEFQNTPDTDAEALRDIILKVADARKTGTIFKRNLNRLLNKQDAPYLAKLAEASIKGMAADYKPVDIGSKLKSYQTIAQLLKVSTAMRNLGGNESFGFLDALVGDTVGQAVDILTKQFTGARSVAPDARWLSSTQRKAARDALNKSVLEVALDVDMGTVGNKYDPRGRSFRMSGGPGERFMSRLSQILSYSLSSSDALFRGGIEAGTEAGLNRLNAGNEEALKQSRDVAEATADYKLFQNRGTTAQMAKNFHDRLNAMVGTGGKVEGGKRSGGFGLGDLIMPYATVPANLGVKAFEYSPAGIVKGGIDLVKTIKQAKAGKLDLKAQNNAVMEIARGTAGVPLAILFASLIKSGIIKRSDDDDDYDVTKARMAENRKETQWNLDATKRWLQGGSREWQEGDDLVSLNWAEPINAFMDIGSLFSALQDEEDEAGLGDYASNYAYGAIQSFTEMPMIEGLQSAINAMRYTDSENIGDKLGAFGESTLTSAATGMVPGLVSQAARVMDPVTRDTGGDNMGERFTNALMNSLPGLREQLPAKLDSFGNPIENDNPLLNALNSTVLPGTVLDYAPNDVVQALDDVYAATGKSNFYPDYKAPNAFTYGGTDYELTADEKRQWQKDFGRNYTALVRATIDSDTYDRMVAETKAKVFGEIRSMAAAEARGNIVEARGGEFQSDYDKVLGLSDVAGYVSTKMMFSSASDPDNRDYKAMDEILKDYKKLPVDVRERLDEWSDKVIPKLYDAKQQGVSTENWYKAYDATKALKPLDGEDEVAKWQKYEAIAKAGLKDKDVDVILGQNLGENQKKAYTDAREAGVKPKTWAQSYATVAQLEPPAGEKGVKEWQKLESVMAMGKSEKETEALLKYWMTQNSENTASRYELGRERGFSQKTLVQAYRICAQNSKKDNMLKALKEAGYSNWQANFLYDLWKGQKTLTEVDKFKKKYKYD